MVAGRAAKLDSLHQARLGHDVFYFSNLRARARFLNQPLRYVRALSDPVTHGRFSPGPRSPLVRYRGVSYYFASDSTRDRFASDQEHYRFRSDPPMSNP